MAFKEKIGKNGEINMNKLSGMMKLRLGITVVFLLLVLSMVIGFYVVYAEGVADRTFAERLTTGDAKDMNRIFSKYPDTGTDGILEAAGYMVWIAILGISYLMFKVWNVKEIKWMIRN